MQYFVADVKTYEAAGAIAVNLRVKKDGNGKLVVAGATDKELGTTVRAVFDPDDYTPVRIRTAIGKVAATGTIAIGTNDGGAVVDGDFLEVLRY